MTSQVLSLAAILLPLGGSTILLELDEGNFQLDVSHYVIMLISFCVPNIPACKKLESTLTFASIDLSQHTPRIPIGTVDCSANKYLCSRYGVTRYPTLKIFRDGSFSEDYDGPVTKKGVAERMIAKFGFASKHIQTMEEFEQILNGDDFIVVGFYPPNDAYLKTFLQTSNALLKYNFSHVTSNEIMKSEKASKIVRLYRPKYLSSVFEAQNVTMKRKPDADNMEQFITYNALGLCGHITEKNMDQFKRPLIVFFLKKLDFVKNAKGANYWRNRAMKVGQEMKGMIKMGIAKRSHLPLILHELDGGETDLMKTATDPLIVIVDEMGKTFVMSDEFSQENFKNFINSFLDGQAKQYIKSQPIPLANDGPVKVVVGNTFNEIVMDKSKDVFVEFYAPWCGHCKTLEPTWNELGKKFVDHDDIVIAKMDATANEIQPGFEVDGYPTIHWAPKNKQNLMQYQGKKTMQAFLKFIEKYSSSKIKVEL